MSRRTEAQISERATMRVSHLAQIEALTKPGLTARQRIKAMCAALGEEINPEAILRSNISVAYAFWCWTGTCPNSLFAYMEDCRCPVQQFLPAVPRHIPYGWKPTAKALEVFSRHQLDYRFPQPPEY